MANEQKKEQPRKVSRYAGPKDKVPRKMGKNWRCKECQRLTRKSKKGTVSWHRNVRRDVRAGMATQWCKGSKRKIKG